MNTTLFIPSKIKVGYQERNDTYSKKLGYVIYFDAKGVLRKETSWQGWRDKKLGEDVFDNVPTEGFVLNKKVGGEKYSWNTRQTYCRVWDPRGWEFEIQIPNLLFILQETNSIKGKGLEGEFVYSWDGKDLVLLPVISEDYKESQEFTKLQNKKVSTKELVEGGIYKTKNQENLIYLGKFNWGEKIYKRGKRVFENKKKFVFIKENGTQSGDLISLNSISNLAEIISNNPVLNYSDLVDIYTNSKYANLPIKIVEKQKKVEFTPFEKLNKQFQDIIVNKSYTNWIEYLYQVSKDYYMRILGDLYRMTIHPTTRNNYNDVTKQWENQLLGIRVYNTHIVKIIDGTQIEEEYVYYNSNKNIKFDKTFSVEEISDMYFIELYVETSQGKLININEY